MQLSTAIGRRQSVESRLSGSGGPTNASRYNRVSIGGSSAVRGGGGGGGGSVLGVASSAKGGLGGGLRRRSR